MIGDFSKPKHRFEGIEYVLPKGMTIYKDMAPTGELFGKVIKKIPMNIRERGPKRLT